MLEKMRCANLLLLLASADALAPSGTMDEHRARRCSVVNHCLCVPTASLRATAPVMNLDRRHALATGAAFVAAGVSVPLPAHAAAKKSTAEDAEKAFAGIVASRSALDTIEGLLKADKYEDAAELLEVQVL